MSLLYRAVVPYVIFGILIFPCGCVAPVGGYGYDNGGIGVDYYEPYGVDYGGWGDGYEVGPYRGGYHGDRGRVGSAPHAFRQAPGSRSMPSIPSAPRGGGGSRGGGGHR